MRTTNLILVATFLLPLAAWAQSAPEAPPKPGALGRCMIGPGPHGKMMMRHRMGKWWKNPDIAKKLQLNDSEINQLDQIFYEHRLKLIDFGAAMEKEDVKLQSLLDADVPNEGQINSQVDQVLTARGKLEREFTMMNLDLRRVLSLEQWRQLKSIREQHGPGDHCMFMFDKKFGPVPAPELPEPAAPPLSPGESF